MIPYVKILPPGSLRVERLSDGRRALLRDLNVRFEGEGVLTVPVGFETDYSSWPRFLPGPRWSKVDVAGVVHDYLFKLGTWGPGGREIGFLEANCYWQAVARAGDPQASVGWVWGWMGKAGLFLGSYPVWKRYRREAG